MSERLALEQQIKLAEIRSVEIDADHFSIVRAEQILLDVGSTLILRTLYKSLIIGKRSVYAQEKKV